MRLEIKFPTLSHKTRQGWGTPVWMLLEKFIALEKRTDGKFLNAQAVCMGDGILEISRIFKIPTQAKSGLEWGTLIGAGSSAYLRMPSLVITPL
jgi:hypothetical protein